MNQMRVKFLLRSLPILLLLPLLTVTVPADAQETEHPIFGEYQWRQVGPSNMSGRVSDLAVPPGGEASTIYVAAAAGGLWKTINNGTTWEQIFEGGRTAAVGDIGIAPSDPNVIYLGMGEPHSRNSISWGDGVWRSTDGGETWRHMGLEYTFHIGRIAVDPRDPMVVYVAALGNLWNRTKGDRGLYKSINGGGTWTKLMGFEDGTGFYEVIIDPKNPDTVYATSWERERKAWVFLSGGGPNNGIWKSTDAGTTWERLEGNGLPPSDRNGKIGLDIFPDDPSIIYARIENFADDPDAPAPDSARAAQMQRMGGRGGRSTPSMNGTWRSRDGGQNWERIDRRNGRPFYYCQIRVDPHDANTVYMVESNLFRVDVEEAIKWVGDYESGGGRGGFGGGGGGDPRGVFNITGSHHVDFHAMWIDPTNTDHLVVGSDGGISVSWDHGETWDFSHNLTLGQFYAVGFDMADPYSVYGGLQDNGTWGGPTANYNAGGITNADWRFFVGGDGFHVQIDPEDPDIILYAESQRGAITRVNVTTGVSRSIRPRAPRPQSAQMSERARQFMGSGGSTNISPPPEPGTVFRFNWSSPIVLSPHNSKTVYFGGNVLFKSVNRGDTWTIISPDLTTNDESKLVPAATNRGDSQTGAENHCNIITIGESPILPGLIWVGTDDGLVHLTRDGGINWTEVTDNFQRVPANTWVSRVRPSAFELGRAYVTFDGHRDGDLTTYVFRTDDFGETWKRLGAGLPTDDPAYVITEDPVNPNLVYLGTESGVYVSLDTGESWSRFNNNLPVVPVHDLAVHPREHDLIIATHGLSIWVMDNVTGLQSLTPEIMEKDFELLEIKPVTGWSGRSQQNWPGDKVFQASNPSTSFKINYWVGKQVDSVQITIEGIDGETLRDMEGPGEQGLNVFEIPIRPRSRRGMGAPQPGRGVQRPLQPGTFKLTVTCGDMSASTIIELKPDPRTVENN